MTQIILNVEDKSLLPGLRKILSSLNGVTIAKTHTTRKGTLSRAVEEVRRGQVTRVNSVSELMAELDSWNTKSFSQTSSNARIKSVWSVAATRHSLKRLLPYLQKQNGCWYWLIQVLIPTCWDKKWGCVATHPHLSVLGFSDALG